MAKAKEEIEKELQSQLSITSENLKMAIEMVRYSDSVHLALINNKPGDEPRRVDSRSRPVFHQNIDDMTICPIFPISSDTRGL